ncbi:MAG: helix-turn-helix transcriptional regulator, partial [Anaerolineae bacterium]|nr:helix-turn-helix transcriptional regulator [Anaerolineae bacterium]
KNRLRRHPSKRHTPSASPPESTLTLGQLIRLVRHQRGMSAEELGHLLYVTAREVQRWENDAVKLTDHQLVSIAHALNIRPDYLLHLCYQSLGQEQGVDLLQYMSAKVFEETLDDYQFPTMPTGLLSFPNVDMDEDEALLHVVLQALEFHGTLEFLRYSRNLSKARLADLVGVGQEKVKRWEKGVSLPTTDEIALLAEALHIHADYLHYLCAVARRIHRALALLKKPIA